jgi:Flp pilus assembly pilin Flp
MRLPPGEEGQGLTEYSQVLVLVAILIMAVVIALGGAIFGLWEFIWETLRQYFAPDAETFLRQIYSLRV